MRMSPERVSTGSISSIFNLCTVLGVSRSDLVEILKVPRQDWYFRREVPKGDGSVRVVYNPLPALRRIQRRINSRILANGRVLAWPHFLYGSLPNQKIGEVVVRKDYVACASVHSQARTIFKLDVKNFFDNVHAELVFSSFCGVLKYPRDVAHVLTELCTWRGHLIQGALTSSYLANLCLYDIEGGVVERLRRKGWAYTRLVDDITVSSPAHDTDFAYADELVSEMLRSRGLPVNRVKTGARYYSIEPLIVHGLRVAYSTPRLLEDEPRRIRAAVKNIESLAAEPGYRQSHSYRHDFNRCMGRVNKLKRVGHKQHRPLLERLKKLLPLPSSADVRRARLLIKRLEDEYTRASNSYGYRKRFYILQERLNVLGRGYQSEAEGIRARAARIRPVRGE